MRQPRHLLLVAFVAFALPSLPGCATIINGRQQSVTIETDPPGASVTILPEDIVLTTPAQVELARKRTHTALVQLEGHRSRIVLIDRIASAAIYWNVLLGGPLGLAIDISSGSAFRLEPAEISVQLSRSRGAAPEE